MYIPCPVGQQSTGLMSKYVGDSFSLATLRLQGRFLLLEDVSTGSDVHFAFYEAGMILPKNMQNIVCIRLLGCYAYRLRSG